MTDPAIRASDAEREQAIELLRSAAAEGRLTLEELADRIETATGARTHGELAQVTADLPTPRPAHGDAAPAAVATPAPIAPGPARNTSVFGDHRRSGPWQLPPASTWETVFGDVKLDLREAHVPAGTITVDVGTVFGDIELLVPEGVAVEVRGRTLFGDVKQDAGTVVAPGAPLIVLTGRTLFGDVRVRARRLRERLAARLLGADA